MLLALLMQATAPAVAPPPVVPTTPPMRRGQQIEWQVLPPMPYREPPQLTEAMTQFVAAEVASGRCRPHASRGTRHRIQADVAVLVTPEGGARVTIPRAIACPTVEQYAAGLVLGFARNNLSTRSSVSQWFRATLTFEWTA
ncbi:hypothetical protein [Sphingomonas baiyangensis]|uniref:TonB C-terminal domain-containing protein n=1 Tax=Sphingomonas baiyangensis TaxID=2572576 RepID=A0A4U1L4E7_9SPHN|nr:hypothetical protein [Sphingomonas baiyangensis]TKD51045.1 hypothetical protein FBR43_09960 [Sphingomonas baiyangensis]